MVGGDIANGSLSAISIVSPKLAEYVESIFIFLWAIGFIFIINLSYIVLKLIFGIIDRKRLKRVEEKVDKISIKLNKLSTAKSKKK